MLRIQAAQGAAMCACPGTGAPRPVYARPACGASARGGCRAVVAVSSEMLVLMLVVAATARLWAPVGASQLCRIRTVRTGKVFNVIQQVQGDVLYFQSGTRLIKHACDKNIALYLGKHVFLTRDNFESSLLPLAIPTSMTVGVPEVTSAHFANAFLLLVVNGKVYTYAYKEDVWQIATGIQHPVSHISGDNCCFVGNTFCTEINNSIFAYSRGEQVSQTTIYSSENGGISFTNFTFKNQAGLAGSLGGVFYFHSLSQIGLLLVNSGKGVFVYSEQPLDRNLGLAFNYDTTLDVFLCPGLRGFLILWSEKTLLVSPNSGQLFRTVQVHKGSQVLSTSISKLNISIHSITANEHTLAVLTKEDALYFGSLEFLSNSIIQLAEGSVWFPEAVLMFSGVGMLDILTPLPDAAFPTFDLQKCPINIQAILMGPGLQIELLESRLESEMYTIDMNSKLNLSFTLIPRLGMSPIPLVMVSNPYSLGLQASIYEEADNTFDGNIVYKLDIDLKQQHHWGRASPNFTSSIKRPTISTLTVDIANREISCVDMKPLSMLISVGCDLEKKIVVQNKISACSKGILDPVELQKNYSYVIEKESYDSSYQGQRSDEDLVVQYSYKDLGCPRLVYYDTPWKPVIELWRKSDFQEIVSAEYVLLEVNGVFTYSYAMTAGSASCINQPQNWTSILETSSKKGPFSWNRENYISCRDSSSNLTALEWPDAQYQVLGGLTDNEIIFDQRNGFYIFHLSIVDPYYSYCQLETTFSIYVYGAYPRRAIPPEAAIVLLVSGLLLAVWLAYLVLHTEEGHRCQQCCASLCCCGCARARH
ncbi:cation channel sperm-associated auxiliary subunit delta isoform X2 [Marmota marmota marmota]|uniref:cation channel sperm-associated auxiliary subunit delta isoform X2 n=1 Tax=Marmota marmota marmota TaxID=9994 RepID=UPI0020932864|nr:cation channel sperm-associated auxiliary subunit delta isoform X2 [Marmota marmota marmota]